MSQLIGHRELKRALRKNEQEAKRKMRLAAQAGGKEIENETVSIINRENIIQTGNLKRSYHTEVEEQGDNIEAIVGTDVEYAPPIEYGSSPYTVNSPVYIKNVGWRYIGTHPGLRPRPHLRPAFDSKKTRALQIMQITLKKLNL